MDKKEREFFERAIDGHYQDLPTYCKEWRISKGIPQTDIAQGGGVGKSCVSRFESGEIKSPSALSGYMFYGMPLPYNLVLDYLKKED